MTTISVTPGDNCQGAANNLHPGDTLLFKVGTHYGRISIPVDGVVIAGEGGAVLDGTQAVTGTWTLATDSDGITSLAGSGTWRVPLSQQAWIVMDSPQSMIFRIDSDFVGRKDWNAYTTMSAYSALAVPNNARTNYDGGADWWNGIEAMWVYNLGNGYLYVRYRDGKKPANLRWSGGHSDHREGPIQAGSVIWLAGRRDVVVKGLEIRGCVHGVAIVDSVNITVEGCDFLAFDFAVEAFASCQKVRVLDCGFDSHLIGTTRALPVSKISTENPYPEARTVAYHQYSMNKFWHDESDSTHMAGVKIRASEYGNPREIEVARNYATCSAFAVDMYGGDGVDIHDNVVEHMWDMSFQRSPGGGRNVKIHDNQVHDAGYCLIRWHGADQEAGDNFVYNNCVSDVDRVSDFVYFAGTYYGKKPFSFWRIIELLIWLWFWLLGRKPSVKSSVPSNLRVWFYNNSFSGGNTVWLIDRLSSMTGFHAVNNLISNNGNTSNAAGWPSEIGLFDYNSMSGALGAYGSWYGGHNITMMPAIWSCSQVEEEFTVPDGHSAKGTGVDVSQPFVINGKTYGPLPGFEPGYFEGTAPDRGYIKRTGENGGGEIVAATLIVTPNSVVPGADVVVSWTGSASNKDWFALYKIGENNAFDKYHWAYCSSCSGSAGTTIKPTGSCIVAMPAGAGSYEFQLYTNDTVTVIATSSPVTVEEAEPEPEPPPEGTMLVYVPALLTGGELIPVEDSEVLKRFMRKKRK